MSDEHPIFRYTRADALRDGVLLDITATAKICARATVPTAITAGLWKQLAGADTFSATDERVKEVCYALQFAMVGLIPARVDPYGWGEVLHFQITLQDRQVKLKAAVTAGDLGGPVMTIMREQED